jgi:hypothetical protein
MIASVAMATPNAKPDKFTLSYSLWIGAPILILVLGGELDRIFNLHILLVPLILIPALAAGMAWLVALIQSASRRRWRRVASIVAAPVIAVSFFAILNVLGIDPDRVRFELSRQYYLDQIAQIPRVGNEPRFKSFPWGETGGAVGANVFRTLEFDESGQIAGTDDQTSDRRYSKSVRALRDHFYIVTETHQ